VKHYFAEVVESLLETADVMLGHAHGCWILNGRHPIGRLWRWAVNRRWNDHAPDHATCPTCHFARHDYETRADRQVDLDEEYKRGMEDGRQELLDEMRNNKNRTFASGAVVELRA
jgi:hypothetical protein